MLGLLWEARKVAREWPDLEVTDHRITGFEYLNEGGFRKVFRGPSGVVYKVEYNDEYSPAYSSTEVGNKGEQETWEFLSQIAPEIVPEHHLWMIDGVPIMAVEYLPKEVHEDEAYAFHRKLKARYGAGIEDSDGESAFNLRKREDGSIMACDAGCGAYSERENLSFYNGTWGRFQNE